MLPSCTHICKYYHVEFIHVADMLHRALGVVFLRIVMHYFSHRVNDEDEPSANVAGQNVNDFEKNADSSDDEPLAR